MSKKEQESRPTLEIKRPTGRTATGDLEIRPVEGRVVRTTSSHLFSDTQKCCIGIWQAARLRSRIRPGRPVKPYQGDLNCPKLMRATSETRESATNSHAKVPQIISADRKKLLSPTENAAITGAAVTIDRQTGRQTEKRTA